MQPLLSKPQIALLKFEHKTAKTKDAADRIKTVIMRNDGWTDEKIAEVLLVHIDTVRRHLKDYDSSAKLESASGGSVSKLKAWQRDELLRYLEEHTYVKVAEICLYVENQYGVIYSVIGMTKWLHANGFSYKKPKTTPLKADPKAQAEFMKSYEALKKNTPADEPILFGDAVHPTMATKVTYGWIKTGSDKAIGTTASRTRINLTGVINLETMQLVMRESDTVDKLSMREFLIKVKEAYPEAPKIHIILDQAGYNKADIVVAKATELGIVIHYLPTYSPNLNPIERLWKVMNEKARNNVVFNSAKEFRARMWRFFDIDYPEMASGLIDRITDNLSIAVKASTF